MPRTGTRAPSSSPVGRRARRDGTIAGSSERSTPKSSSSSSSQSSVASEQSSVRDAFVRSVACTSPPLSFQTSHASTVPKARPGRRVLAQQPLELRRREVRVRHEAGPLADQPGVELAAAVGGAPVLPDDRGADRPAGRALPEQRRLTLVRDPDRLQVGRAGRRRLREPLRQPARRRARSPRDRARPSPAGGSDCGSSR